MLISKNYLPTIALGGCIPENVTVEITDLVPWSEESVGEAPFGDYGDYPQVKSEVMTSFHHLFGWLEFTPVAQHYSDLNKTIDPNSIGPAFTKSTCFSTTCAGIGVDYAC
ncbi:hypothetical protein V2G26_001419 [Clonostachys chloroleuca]